MPIDNDHFLKRNMRCEEITLRTVNGIDSQHLFHAALNNFRTHYRTPFRTTM